MKGLDFDFVTGQKVEDVIPARCYVEVDSLYEDKNLYMVILKYLGFASSVEEGVLATFYDAPAAIEYRDRIREKIDHWRNEQLSEEMVS